MYFALTLTKNRRDGFHEDVTSLSNICELMMNDGIEFGRIGWEIQEDPTQHHCLHLHSTVSFRKMPYMMNYTKALKEHGINWKLKDLSSKEDLSRWYKYLTKDERKDLAFIYSETGSVPSKCIF